jgi:ubiquinone/menaquinone biosynthesis C-methylase UbiE
VNNGNNRVFPVRRAGSLDNRFRRWLQDPYKILGPYIKKGMTVLDLGCGPGFFTIDMAQLVGKSGRVIASDLQEGMLQKLKGKIQGTDLEEIIKLHKCEKNKIGLTDNVDFVFAFYVVHEVSNQEELFIELGSMLRPDGRVFIVEPSFRVSKTAFDKTINKARDAGFTSVKRPKMLLSRAVVLEKG